MKTKLFIIILTGLALNLNILAQKGYAEKINQFNDKGQKEGLWIEEDKYHKYFMYYQNDVLNGTYYVINTAKNVLSSLGQYLNGKHYGIWYYFGAFGHLIMIQKNFKKNDKPIPAEHHAQGTCLYQCYSISYYPNGNKESEGILLWDESPESDFTFEYGEWKYYADTGELIKTKNFK
ncbi:MAG: hypothetical protein LBN93_05495 [Candidatus Symbiothrix sp.]|jgi:hypothetical protein|nr:hypothetical protein [Candidatus Symbiothrix sp.]